MTPLSLGACLLGAVALCAALSLRSAVPDGWRGLDMNQRDGSTVEAQPLGVPDTKRVMRPVGGYDGRHPTIAPSRTDDTTGWVRSRRVVRPDSVVRQHGVDVHLGNLANMMSPSAS